MAFSRRLLPDFETDPFFRDTNFPSGEFRDPFGDFLCPGRSQAVIGPQPQTGSRRDVALPFGAMWPFGGVSPFARMDAMFQGMQQMVHEAQNDPNAHGYSSSTVTHYSSTGGVGGRPHFYQASSSTTSAPGRIKETRKAVRDSESGVQKMAVGHHIGDRSHTVERRYNANTKEQEEHQTYFNIDESDARTFNQDWQEKTRPINRAFYGPPRHHAIEHRMHHADTRGLPVPSGVTHPEIHNRQSHGKRKQRPPSLSNDFGDGSCLDSDTCHRIKHAKAHCPHHGDHDHDHCSSSSSSSATARSYHPSFQSTGATGEVHRHSKARTGHSKTAVKFDTTGSGPTEKKGPNKYKGTHA